jgi:bleomycin hydrolase
VRLNPDDYVDVLSLMQKPYYQFVEYEVPDNWWHSKDYLNVPVGDFMGAIKSAIRNGYTVCIGGDVSEPGYEGHAGLAVVPTFDIPSSYIDDNARQFRFSNGTTGDDHGIHIVGYVEKDGKDWYLIKDSGSGSRNNHHPGYYFYTEDYVKLKMLGFMVHKDAVKNLLSNLQK